MKKIIITGVLVLSALGLSSCNEKIEQIPLNEQLNTIKLDNCYNETVMNVDGNNTTIYKPVLDNYAINIVYTAKNSDVVPSKDGIQHAFSIMDVCNDAVTISVDSAGLSINYLGSYTTNSGHYTTNGQYIDELLFVEFDEGEFDNYIFELEITDVVAQREQIDIDTQFNDIKSEYCNGTTLLLDNYYVDIKLLSKDYTTLDTMTTKSTFSVSDVCHNAITLTSEGGMIYVNYIEGIDGYVTPGHEAGQRVAFGFQSEDDLSKFVIVLVVNTITPMSH